MAEWSAEGQRESLTTGSVIVAVVTIVLAAGLCWGVASALGESASPSVAQKTVLRVGWVNEPDNLNPFIGTSTSSFLIFHLNYDLLTGYRAKDVQPTSELAESWSVSPDQKVWTFKLRPGVKWQDGVPFTARDVAFTYNYIVDNQLEAYTSYTDGLEHVEAVDDLTARFICSRPKSNMLGMWVPIVPEHIWSNVSPTAAGKSFQNKPPIVGTGPFQVVDFNKQDRYVRMVANKDYWRGAPLIDEVVFSAYANPDAMVQDLRSAAIDACWGIPEGQFAPLSQAAGFKAISYVVKGFDELGFNCYTGPSLGNPVLKDWRFRQALNWAIDKRQLVQTAYAGYAVPGDTIIVPDFYTDPDWHWQPTGDVLYGYDPAKATQLLAEAGYRTAGGRLLDKQGKPMTLRLLACDAPPQGQKIGMLLTSWLQAIGIKVKFSYMTEAAMNGYLYNEVNGRYTPNMDLYVYNWTGDLDPTFILSIFLTSQIGDGWSDCYWSDQTYDSLFNQQSQTIDPQARRDIIWKMQQILYRQSPYIVLAYPKGLEALDTAHWQGWVQSPSGIGSAIYSVDNIDSYLYVHPKAAAAGAGRSPSLLIAAVVAAVAVAGIVAWLLLRRRPKALEE